MSNFSLIESSFEIKEVNEDDNNFIINGKAAVYNNVDLGRDVIEEGAFNQDLMKNTKPRTILFSHDSLQPIGTGELKDNKTFLGISISLPKADTFVTGRVMPQVKAGSITGLSIGYSVDDYSFEDRNGHNVRILKRCKVFEVSLCCFPMNTRARITAAKQFLANYDDNHGPSDKTVPVFKDYPLADEKLKWDKKKSVNDIRENTNSTESPSKNYKKGFFFFDSDEEDDFGGYKLPYVYWIDGGFKVVPRALFAVTGALAGARGGVNIPEGDKSKIKNQLNKYYKELGREEPFKGDKTFIDVTTLECVAKRDIEKIFDDDIILSTQAKRLVADRMRNFEKKECKNDQESGELLGVLKELNKELDIK